MNIKNCGEWLEISGIGDFSVLRTFDCGQCFRFDPVEDENFSHRVDGIAFGRAVSFAEKGDGILYVKANEEVFHSIWGKFLGLDRDYGEINDRIINALSGNDRLHMEKAAEASKGIRILAQDKWEALCSCIVSQNNNIPRIKKIITSMSEAYGEKIDGGYAFPTAEALAAAGPDKLFELKTGFRAKYIYDAAEKVASGKLDLEAVANAATYEEAEGLLLTIKGVGAKVAACTLLFGFNRFDAFPIDVWIKRVIEKRFPEGLDHKVFGDVAGIAQQYLFYYERYIVGKE